MRMATGATMTKMINHVKQVRETIAGKYLSAYLVLSPVGHEVATIHVYKTQNSKGPLKWVDVFQPRSQDNGFSQYKGRDLTNAMAGGKIDGITLYDDCQTDEALQYLLLHYKLAKTESEKMHIVKMGQDLGASWCNPGLDDEPGWTQLYYITGLKRLEYFGYRVIQVL